MRPLTIAKFSIFYLVYTGASTSGKSPAFGAGNPRFESWRPSFMNWKGYEKVRGRIVDFGRWVE